MLHRRDFANRVQTIGFKPLAESKQLTFTVDNRVDEIVSGDKDRIISIGSNLLSNAIKFTKSGTITLSTDYKDGMFMLSVSDTGTGMTKEQQQRIFTPFERLGNAVTEDGFGLGLAIVSDTVKLLKGSINVESEPGKGSRFTVSLPLPKAEEAVAGEKKQENHVSLSGYSILAIDNDILLLNMLHDMYRQHGVECDTCQSVDELTDLMRTKNYDLLITDLKMPEINGYEVLELLRTSEIGNSQTIPVVAATAAGYVEEEELKGKGFAALHQAEQDKPHRPLAPARFRRQAAHIGKVSDHYAIRHGGSAQGGGSQGHGDVG